MVHLLYVAVCVVVPHAKLPVRAEKLGSNAGVGAFCRRPSGLRGNGWIIGSPPRRNAQRIKLTVNCKKTLCKKYFIISIGILKKMYFCGVEF